MMVLPLGWTSNSYDVPRDFRSRSSEQRPARTRQRGAVKRRSGYAAQRSHRDIVLALGWTSSAYSRG